MGCTCSNPCCQRTNRDPIEIAITTRGQMELRTVGGEKKVFIIPKVVVTSEYNAIEVIYMPERVAAAEKMNTAAGASGSAGVKKRPFSLPGLQKQTSTQKSSSSSSTTSSGSSGGTKKKQKPEKKPRSLLEHGRKRIGNHHRLGEEIAQRKKELNLYC